jgi:hypothetical protein
MTASLYVAVGGSPAVRRGSRSGITRVRSLISTAVFGVLLALGVVIEAMLQPTRRRPDRPRGLARHPVVGEYCRC